MEKIRAAMWHTKPFFPTYIICKQVGSQYFACGNLISSHPNKYNNQVTGLLALFTHFLIPNSVPLFFFFFCLGEQVSLLHTELGFFNCQCLRLQFNNNLNRPTFPPLTHHPPLFQIP